MAPGPTVSCTASPAAATTTTAVAPSPAWFWTLRESFTAPLTMVAHTATAQFIRSLHLAQSLSYSFTGGSDGSLPTAGVIFDSSGNLYGATAQGGSGGSGVVFELSPGDNGWTYSEIYPLPGGGWGPYERLVLDASG